MNLVQNTLPVEFDWKYGFRNAFCISNRDHGAWNPVNLQCPGIWQNCHFIGLYQAHAWVLFSGNAWAEKKYILNTVWVASDNSSCQMHKCKCWHHQWKFIRLFIMLYWLNMIKRLVAFYHFHSALFSPTVNNQNRPASLLRISWESTYIMHLCNCTLFRSMYVWVRPEEIPSLNWKVEILRKVRRGVSKGWWGIMGQ